MPVTLPPLQQHYPVPALPAPPSQEAFNNTTPAQQQEVHLQFRHDGGIYEGPTRRTSRDLASPPAPADTLAPTATAATSERLGTLSGLFVTNKVIAGLSQLIATANVTGNTSPAILNNALIAGSANSTVGHLILSPIILKVTGNLYNNQNIARARIITHIASPFVATAATVIGRTVLDSFGPTVANMAKTSALEAAKITFVNSAACTALMTLPYISQNVIAAIINAENFA